MRKYRILGWYSIAIITLTLGMSLFAGDMDIATKAVAGTLYIPVLGYLLWTRWGKVV